MSECSYHGALHIFQMPESNNADILENLLYELGSFGRFQMFLLVFLFLPMSPIAYTLVLPSFNSVAPDWWCVPVGGNDSQSQHTKEHFKVCTENGTACAHVYDKHMKTPVSEVRVIFIINF